MRRKWFIILFAMFLSFSVLPFTETVNADSDYSIILDDEEDLLTDSEEKLLIAKMSEIRKYGNVAFVSVSQYGDTSSYAKSLYREYFGKDSGFLFLIDMGRRNIWIFSDGEIYRIIDRAYANTITDNVYRHASKGNYYDCAWNVYDQAQILLEGGRIAQPMKYISNVLIACVCALLVNFFFLTAQREKDDDILYSAAPALASSIGIRILSKKITSSRSRKHVESSGGSSGGGGGGFSGGGGGGGGSSGGGGGHSF